jgi:hypothetical protein
MRLFTALLFTICLTIPSHAGDDPGRKLHVVVFGGHPDDPESGAEGNLPRSTKPTGITFRTCGRNRGQ